MQPEVQHAPPSPAPTKDVDTELPDAPPPVLPHSQKTPVVEKEPVKEPVKESVSESVKEPSKEPAEEPAKESAKEPISEPLNEATEEPPKESPKEQVKVPAVVSEKEPEKDDSVREPSKEELAAKEEPLAKEQPAKEKSVKEEPTKETTKAESPKELIKEAQATPVKIKALELKVQLPTTSALDSSAAAAPTTTTPSSATSSIVQSAITSGNLSSPFSAAVNGAVATPSPIKKKLSLSDYKSRMNKVAAKPSISLISTKSTLSEADEIKLENPIESTAIEKVESAVAPSAPAATTNGHA
jgi:hypothetical protein